MGLFDAPPTPAPVSAAPAAATPMDQTTFINNLIAAAAAQGKANPGSLWNWLSGNATDAATKAATAAAPGAWQQFQDSQNKLQMEGLNNAQTYGATNAMTGVNVDPNNPMASVPGLTKAYGGVFNGVAPQSGSSPAPAAETAPQADPLQQQRAIYMRFGRLTQMRGDNPGAKMYFDMANQGVPAGTAVLPDGSLAEGGSGAPVSGMTAGQLKAAEDRPGQTQAADIAVNQAGRSAAASQAGTNSQTPVQVIGRNGPMTVPASSLLKAGGSQVGPDGQLNFVAADSPQYKAIQGNQQSDLKTLKENSVQSQGAADTALQLYNAANEIPKGTGTFGETQQALRKLAIGALQAAHANVDPALANDAAAFEKMNFAGLNFVQSSAHSFSPRAALQIVKMIQNVKPGDKTTAQGIKQIIEQEVLPGVQRDKDLYGQASDYYNKNPLKTDAMSVVPGKNPLEKYRVKHDLSKVVPGDYFVDPRTGQLRQRATQ